MTDPKLARETIKALAPAAKAFAKAQKLGYVQLQTALEGNGFEVCGPWEGKPPPHPDQLRLI